MILKIYDIFPLLLLSVREEVQENAVLLMDGRAGNYIDSR